MSVRTFSAAVASLIVITACAIPAPHIVDGPDYDKAEASYAYAEDTGDTGEYAEDTEQDTGWTSPDDEDQAPEDTAGLYDRATSRAIVLHTWVYDADGVLLEAETCSGKVALTIEQDDVSIVGTCAFYKLPAFELDLQGTLDGHIVADGTTRLDFYDQSFKGEWSGYIDSDDTFRLLIDDTFEFDAGREPYIIKYTGGLSSD